MKLRTAGKIAFRDLAASRGKFAFIVLAIAVGVGSLSGVRGFSRSFRAMLKAETRTLMAADLSLRVFELPTPEQIALLETFPDRTQITETVTMLSPGPVLISLKAVDQSRYPFYGELKLEPPVKLTPDMVAVSEDLLIRTDLKRGDAVRVGEAEFRIAAIVKTEPDRMAGTANIGARVMMSREGLDRTGLIKPGSRAGQRHIFKLVNQDVEQVRQRLKEAFPNAQIADYRETQPMITRGLERSERFLSLVSLIALIIGAIGVAATMHSHLQQRLDTIAIMKCIGGRTGQILRIYVLQTLTVGLAGGLLGCVFGALVQAAFPLLISRYFSLTPTFALDPMSALEALTIGLLTATLFTVPTLLNIEQIRPLEIFRRNVSPMKSTLKGWLARLVILAAIGGLATYLSDARTGAWFAGGLVASLLILAAFAWLILWLLKSFPRKAWPATVRQGIANIHRPGNQATAVLVSLGVGVMFTLTIYLVQHGMLNQILEGAPPTMPNVFLLNISGREKAGIERLLAGRPEIQGTPEIIPAVAARLQHSNPRFSQARAVTSGGPRPNSVLLQGAWGSKPNQVCVMERAAKELEIHVNDHLTWKAGIETIEATVTCIFRSEEVRMGANMDFVFTPGTLDHVALQYLAAIRMKASAVTSFQREAFKKFPSVVVINGADIIEIVQQVVDQIALVVRFISAFAVLAGLIILASSVAATRFHRVREIAILKTLGATKRKIATIFSVEFLILGSAAGLLGGILATAFSNLILVRLLEAKSKVDFLPIVVSIILSALTANTAGWLISARLLNHSPLSILRSE